MTTTSTVFQRIFVTGSGPAYIPSNAPNVVNVIDVKNRGPKDVIFGAIANETAGIPAYHLLAGEEIQFQFTAPEDGNIIGVYLADYDSTEMAVLDVYAISTS